MVIIGKRGYDIFGEELREMGYEPFALKGLDGLNDIVCDHVDSLICDAGNLIIPEALVSDLPQWARERFVTSADRPCGNYPQDIAFNALRVGKRLFGRIDCLSKDVTVAAEEHEIELVYTKQGYAKCAAMTIDGAVVTADKGLAKILKKCNIEVLTIPSGGIRLEGCEYGFVGGASFVDEREKRVVFFGEMPGEWRGDVMDFCGSHGFCVHELCGELTDIGGAMVLRETDELYSKDSIRALPTYGSRF